MLLFPLCITICILPYHHTTKLIATFCELVHHQLFRYLFLFLFVVVVVVAVVVVCCCCEQPKDNCFVASFSLIQSRARALCDSYLFVANSASIIIFMWSMQSSKWIFAWYVYRKKTTSVLAPILLGEVQYNNKNYINEWSRIYGCSQCFWVKFRSNANSCPKSIIQNRKKNDDNSLAKYNRLNTLVKKNVFLPMHKK